MSDHTIVAKLGELSRITISDEEKSSFGKEFEAVIEYVSSLGALELDVHATPAVPVVHNIFREDTLDESEHKTSEAIVDAFPQKEGRYLQVKKILSYE